MGGPFKKRKTFNQIELPRILFHDIRRVLVFFTVIGLCHLNVQAQDMSYKVLPDSGAVVFITGGSTLHDWTVTTKEVLDFPKTLGIADTQPGVIDQFGFAVEVEPMEGGRGATMDKKIRQALMADQYPRITYVQNDPAIIEMTGSGGHFKLVSRGSVNIAGISRPLEVEVTGQKANGRLVFAGSQNLLLSDFDIAPPTAMFGQIKTKNEITVHFKFIYSLIEE